MVGQMNHFHSHQGHNALGECLCTWPFVLEDVQWAGFFEEHDLIAPDCAVQGFISTHVIA